MTGGTSQRPQVFRNAHLLDPANGVDETGSVLVDEAGKIAAIGRDVVVDPIQQDIAAVDCQGQLLIPGLVDMRVYSREPGDEHMETLKSLSRSAIAGGVTSLACMPNTDPVIDDVSLLQFIQRRAQSVGLVNIHAYAAATKGLHGRELTEYGLLAENGAVGFTDGNRTLANPLVLRRALSYASLFKRPIIQHPEEPTLAHDGVMNEGEVATRLGLAGIPAKAEVMIIERDLHLVEITNGRYHVANISTAEGIAAIRRAKANGLAVTCDTAPHYFALNDGAVTDYRTFAKVSPPLRAEADRLAVIDGLADGTIDAIASDHAPHSQDSKRLPFAQAETGVVGLETLLPLTLELVHRGDVSLATAIAALTAGPAKILGLSAGRLKVGDDADLTLVNLTHAGRIDVANFRSKSKNSPFNGRPIEGRVLRTVRAGVLVYDRLADARLAEA